VCFRDRRFFHAKSPSLLSLPFQGSFCTATPLSPAAAWPSRHSSGPAQRRAERKKLQTDLCLSGGRGVPCCWSFPHLRANSPVSLGGDWHFFGVQINGECTEVLGVAWLRHRRHHPCGDQTKLVMFLISPVFMQATLFPQCPCGEQHENRSFLRTKRPTTTHKKLAGPPEQ